MSKKIIFITITFLMCISVVYSQTISDIKAAYQQADYQKCIQLADTFIKKNPKSPEISTALYLQGGAAMKVSDYDKSINSFTRILENYPDFQKIDQVLYFRAYSYYKKGLDAEARVDINTLKTKYPNSDYVPKADALLAEMNSMSDVDLDSSYSAGTSQKKDKYSISKITWAKIGAGLSLVACPVFLVMANSAQKDADSIYDNKYMKATSESQAIAYWNQVVDKDKEAANLKTYSLISFFAAAGFFALDYFVVGRVPATPQKHSFDIPEKREWFTFNYDFSRFNLNYTLRF